MGPIKTNSYIDQGGFPLSCNFYVLVHGDVTCVNKNEALYKRSRVNVKAMRESTFTLTRSLSNIASILSARKIYTLTHVKITQQWKSTQQQSTCLLRSASMFVVQKTGDTFRVFRQAEASVKRAGSARHTRRGTARKKLSPVERVLCSTPASRWPSLASKTRKENNSYSASCKNRGTN